MNKKLFTASTLFLTVPIVSVISCSSNNSTSLTEHQKHYLQIQSWITNPKKFVIEAPIIGEKTNDELKEIEQNTKYNHERITDPQIFIDTLGLSKFETIDKPEGIALIEYKIVLRTTNVPMGMPYEYYIYIKCMISSGEVITFRHETVLRSSDFAGQDVLNDMNDRIVVNVGEKSTKTFAQLKGLESAWPDGTLMQNQSRADDLAKILGMDSIVFGDVAADYIVRLFIEEVEGVEYGQQGQFNIIVSIRLKHFEYMNSTKTYRLLSSDLKQRTDKETVSQVVSEINVSNNLITKTFEELDAIASEGDYTVDINNMLGEPITIPSDLLGARLTYTIFANPKISGSRVHYDVKLTISKGTEWDVIDFTLQSTNIYTNQTRGSNE